MREAPILMLEGVSKRFARRLDSAARLTRWLRARNGETVVHAVNGVNLAMTRGEVVGLVGESGCGKSTLGKIVAGLSAVSEGRRLWYGQDTALLSASLRRRQRLKVQMIFQDPFSSLNPRLRVSQIVGEAPLAHGLVKSSEVHAFVSELLARVGLDPTRQRDFPHQFSGGQQARVGIARALAVHPEFLVCDEATTALDVSIQAQVLNLFMQLREELQLTYLFISHDLAVVRHLCDRIFIMYLGQIVESAPANELFERPNHPYTQGLLDQAPTLEVRKRAFVAIQGEIPSPFHPPTGCHFHPRCRYAMTRCVTESPVLKEIAPNRFSACHLNDER